MRPLLTFSDRFFPPLPASSRDLRDVEKSVKNAQALYARLDELLSGGSGDSEEIGWCTNELNTLLKSIEWDIEDLSETIAIVEESPGRFKVGEPLPVPEVAASNTPCTCLTHPPPPTSLAADWPGRDPVPQGVYCPDAANRPGLFVGGVFARLAITMPSK